MCKICNSDCADDIDDIDKFRYIMKNNAVVIGKYFKLYPKKDYGRYDCTHASNKRMINKTLENAIKDSVVVKGTDKKIHKKKLGRYLGNAISDINTI